MFQKLKFQTKDDHATFMADSHKLANAYRALMGVSYRVALSRMLSRKYSSYYKTLLVATLRRKAFASLPMLPAMPAMPTGTVLALPAPNRAKQAWLPRMIAPELPRNEFSPNTAFFPPHIFDLLKEGWDRELELLRSSMPVTPVTPVLPALPVAPATPVGKVKKFFNIVLGLFK